MGKKEYLEILTAQIRNEKAKKFVGEEIEAHIDDQTEKYLEYGLDSDAAEKKAVRSMGDPVETGVSMDRIHKPKMSWGVVVLVAILSGIGLLLQFTVGYESGDMYFFRRQVVFVLIGFCIMLGICLLDYSRLVFYGKMVAAVYLLIVIVCSIAGQGVVNGAYFFVTLGSISLSTAVLAYLAVPIFACLLYLYRNEQRWKLLCPVGFVVVIGLWYLRVGGSLLVMLNLIFAAGAVMTYAFVKGWYGQRIKLMVGLLWGILLGIPLLRFLVMIFRARHGEALQLATYQMERLQALLDGSGSRIVLYGSYRRIQSVLDTVQWFGASESVGTLKVAEYAACDYLLLYGTAYYGVLALVVVLILLCLFCTKIFASAVKQRNQAGTIIGISCGVLFVLLMAEYVLMNLGVIPGTTVFLPLLSYGGSVTIMSFILLGLILSIYRYQNLVSEQRHRRKRLVIKLMDV